MKKAEAAGGIITNSRGEIALARSGPDFWGFPKGHIEEGENALAAARREIAEETGLEYVSFVKELGSYERHKSTPEGGDDMSEFKTIHMLLFTAKQAELAPTDPANPEARWVPHAKVEEMLTHPKDREFWKSIMPTLGLL